MKSPHILLAGTNIRQVKNNLGHVIDAVAVQAIEDEISRNVTQLFTLGLHHSKDREPPKRFSNEKYVYEPPSRSS